MWVFSGARLQVRKCHTLSKRRSKQTHASEMLAKNPRGACMQAPEHRYLNPEPLPPNSCKTSLTKLRSQKKKFCPVEVKATPKFGSETVMIFANTRFGIMKVITHEPPTRSYYFWLQHLLENPTHMPPLTSYPNLWHKLSMQGVLHLGSPNYCIKCV